MLLDAGAKITQSHYLLHYAIMHRHTEMAELLLKAGSIVNLRDDNGDSPLIVAARTGVCQLAELLLRNGIFIMKNIMFVYTLYPFSLLLLQYTIITISPV